MRPIRQLPLMLGTRIGRLRIRCWAIEHSRALTRRLSIIRRRTLPETSRVIAITGSYGKSTTTRIIECCLGRNPSVVPRPNNPANLYAWFWRQRSNLEHLVVETGISRPGQMARLASVLRPHVAVVTSIGGEHKRSFETLATTRREKLELLRKLTPDGFAVINNDDPNVRWMGAQISRPVFTVGMMTDADYRAEDLQADVDGGTSFRLVAPDASLEVFIPLIGRHMVTLALLGLAVADRLGLDLAVAAERLSTLPPTQSRLQLVRLPGGVRVLRDELKSGEETIYAAFDALATLRANRKIVLLDGIDEPSHPLRPCHYRVAVRALQVADQILTTGPAGKMYKRGVKQAGLDSRRVHVLPGLDSIIDHLKSIARSGDLILLKGRRRNHWERAYLALAGYPMHCHVDACSVPLIDCEACPARAGEPRELRLAV